MPGRPFRIVLAGGGTGGHVYPALAIAEIARRRLGEIDVLFVGVRGRAEEQIVPRASVRIEFVDGRGLTGGIAGLPGFASSLARGTRAARVILRDFDPDLVVATGGFSSAPTVFAAAWLRAARGRPRLLVHEQNALPGRMNRVAGRLADRVCATFGSSIRFFARRKVVHTGYPVRTGIGSRDRASAREALGLPHDAFVVLSFGGSLGSRSLNRAIAGALPALLASGSLHVIHGTGRYSGSDYDPQRDTAEAISRLGMPVGLLRAYHPLPYIEDMAGAYAAADLVVARSGAGTLSEIEKAAIPSVLIPKMGLPHEHQLANARDFESSGAARVVVEGPDPEGNGLMRVDPRALAQVITGLAEDPAALLSMKRVLSGRKRPDTEKLIGDALSDLLSV